MAVIIIAIITLKVSQRPFEPFGGRFNNLPSEHRERSRFMHIAHVDCSAIESSTAKTKYERLHCLPSQSSDSSSTSLKSQTTLTGSPSALRSCPPPSSLRPNLHQNLPQPKILPEYTFSPIKCIDESVRLLINIPLNHSPTPVMPGIPNPPLCCSSVSTNPKISIASAISLKRLNRSVESQEQPSPSR